MSGETDKEEGEDGEKMRKTTSRLSVLSTSGSDS
jgi:hypothetical protein